jgi:hypothetical protein
MRGTFVRAHAALALTMGVAATLLSYAAGTDRRAFLRGEVPTEMFAWVMTGRGAEHAVAVHPQQAGHAALFSGLALATAAPPRCRWAPC